MKSKENSFKQKLHLTLSLINKDLYQTEEFKTLKKNLDPSIIADGIRVYANNNIHTKIYNVKTIDRNIFEQIIAELMKHSNTATKDITNNLEKIINILLQIVSLQTNQAFTINNHEELKNLVNYAPTFIHVASKILNHLSCKAQQYGKIEFSSDFFDRESIFHKLNPQQQDEFFSTIHDKDASAFILTFIENKLSEKSKNHLIAIFKQKTNDHKRAFPAYFE